MDRADFTKIFKQPVVVFPIFIDMCGSLAAAVLLAQLFYWHDRGGRKDGWIYKTSEQWFNETRLTRKMQQTARRRLRELGILEEHLSNDSQLWFRLNLDALYTASCAALKGWDTRFDDTPDEPLPPARHNSSPGPNGPPCSEPCQKDVPTPMGQTAHPLDDSSTPLGQTAHPIYVYTESTTESTTENTSERGQSAKPKKTKTVSGLHSVQPASPKSEEVILSDIDANIPSEAVVKMREWRKEPSTNHGPAHLIWRIEQSNNAAFPKSQYTRMMAVASDVLTCCDEDTAVTAYEFQVASYQGTYQFKYFNQDVAGIIKRMDLINVGAVTERNGRTQRVLSFAQRAQIEQNRMDARGGPMTGRWGNSSNEQISSNDEDEDPFRVHAGSG